VAQVILAETGADMTRFGSAARLASWAGLVPAIYESAGRRTPAGTRHGNKWLTAMLVNILLPSGWIAGQDALAFAAAMAPQTRQITQLVALRMGEVWPPMLARALATLDHIAKGRLCINIISSDMPGSKESNEVRYERASEIIQILQGLWSTDGPYEWNGKYYQIKPAEHRTREALSAERRPADVFRRHLTGRTGPVREALRRLPDVAGDGRLASPKPCRQPANAHRCAQSHRVLRPRYRRCEPHTRTGEERRPA